MNRIEIGGSDTASPLNVAKRVGLVRQWAELADKRILDAGCGAGEFVEAFAGFGAIAQGVEFEEAKVRTWLEKRPGDHRVRQGDLEHLDFPDASFDVVFLNEVLEHIPDDRRALSELQRVLSDNGTLIVLSPNRYHPFETHGVYSWKTGAHFSILRTMIGSLPPTWRTAEPSVGNPAR
jgi:2-polyprenyl-3-methyl-5-hydroxy-6-metoxy-1,4-benzoquinol methylase